MDRDTERTLAIAALAGDTAARDQLIASIWRFIFKQAIRLENKHGKPAQDLAQVGAMRVVEMFHKFNPHRGCRFITYFGKVAIRAMEREAKLDGVIRLHLGYHGTAKKLAAAMRVCDQAMVSMTDLSDEFGEFSDADSDPADIVSLRDELSWLRKQVALLPDEQGRMMALKMRGLTYPEMAAAMGVTRRDIKRLDAAAKFRLKKQMACEA